MAFINYEKVFYSVDPAAVLELFNDHGIEETDMRLLEDIYKGYMGGIILHKKSEQFLIRRGVRQGDANLQKLFTARLQEA